jgi:hypothetical protein
MHLSDDWTEFEHEGRTYAAKLERDEHHGAPWDEEDGHGDVTGWETRDKSPGEMILCEDRHAKRFYDFAGAVKRAKAEGWDAKPYKTGTKSQQAHRAALADFNRLCAWCNDDWCYVGVIVAPVCECCGEVQDGKAASLWGIESDAGDYLAETARELIAEIEPDIRTAA